MQAMSNTKNSNSRPLITPMTTQIEIETNNNKIRNTSYNVQSFTDEEEEASIGDQDPRVSNSI